MRKLRTILAHLCIIFAGALITMAILHLYNPPLGILTSSLSIAYIFLFAALVALLSVATIAENRHYKKRMIARETAARKKSGARPPRLPEGRY